ncbi:MAG: modification methylase, HemK family [Bryobacterales bacterium]|nr:modification methylase, HemK family [Bryobacterales bacterium]
MLLAHAVGHERAWLYAHSDEELREVWWIHYGRYLHQRLQGRPTQQITGVQEFYGRDFRVTPDVLIPRPETEHVIEAALKLRARNVVDIGTGSGAIAITLALETAAHVVGTDISLAALNVAVANGRRLGASVQWLACDLASALPSGSFDLVVSNPPYVPASDKTTLQREVRDYEPEVALYGGDDGLDIFRRLVPEAERLLSPGGWLVMEIGYALGDAVSGIIGMTSAWREVEVRPDLAGLPRVIVARKS